MSYINKLGFNDWFRDKIDLSKDSNFHIVRVTSVNKNSFMVSDGVNDIYAELTGKFLFNSDSPLDLPTSGDWVYAQLFDNGTFAVIHDILPRKSVLKRKTPGKKVEFQLIAANIDAAIIMQALDNNFNLRRLERYLVMINEEGIKPVVLLSKSDLSTPEEIELNKKEILKISPGIRIEAFSNNNQNDIEIIKELFTSGETFCLIGSSGVGKTTLLNNLIHEELHKTGPIREKDGRGKHTTTRRELTIIDNGAIIIDTPGMRELALISSEGGLSDTFNEIDELAENCQFKDCTHTVEKGCAVLNGVETGIISKERYQNFIKMYKESEYYKMSYLEKRQKEKKFGKFIHTMNKNLPKKRQ